MATYAIGDLQGCCERFQRLLDLVAFDPTVDRLWLVGDLVNRGPDSLGTLRLVRELGDAAVTVLGNHDLHLLAVWHGAAGLRPDDTLEAILNAPDAEELLEWLSHRPLVHEEAGLPGYMLLHAGLPPQWDPATARAGAREVEACLRGSDRQAYFDHLYGDEPRYWEANLQGWDRLRFITNALTRLRFCHTDGRMALDYKGRPSDQPQGIIPWFQAPGRVPFGKRVVFGHWSLLGHHDGHGVLALDTGCLWGGCLTAARIDDGSHATVATSCAAAS